MATKDNLSEHIALTVLLLTAVLANVDHGLCMLLIDDAQIPVDQRYRLTTKANFATEYEEDTEPYLFATDFWSQLRSASQLMFGRWISEDTTGYYVGGVPSSDMAAFEILGATAGFSIAVEGVLAGVATDVNDFDFDPVADIEDVVAAINVKLHTVATAAYAAYDVAIDPMGRIYVSKPDYNSSVFKFCRRVLG
jgi:hypothetical protein